jgi:CDP-diacylglycerol--serine O-phosphatidyltransferase
MAKRRIRIVRVSNPIPKFAKYTANFITSTNLALGILSILLSFNHIFKWSEIALIAAVLTDRLDGSTARRMGITSHFGKELDSLSDLVSFGVAPAILVYALVFDTSPLPGVNLAGIVSSVLYVICGALRLARFNVMNISTGYIGVPITFAGGLLVILCLAHRDFASWMFVFFEVILSLLMISRIRIKKV